MGFIDRIRAQAAAKIVQAKDEIDGIVFAPDRAQREADNAEHDAAEARNANGTN